MFLVLVGIPLYTGVFAHGKPAIITKFQEQAEVAGQVVASVRKSLRDVLAGKIEEPFFSLHVRLGLLG